MFLLSLAVALGAMSSGLPFISISAAGLSFLAGDEAALVSNHCSPCCGRSAATLLSVLIFASW